MKGIMIQCAKCYGTIVDNGISSLCLDGYVGRDGGRGQKAISDVPEKTFECIFKEVVKWQDQVRENGHLEVLPLYPASCTNNYTNLSFVVQWLCDFWKMCNVKIQDLQGIAHWV